MKKKPTRADYDIFKWLTIERWSEDTIMGPRLNQMIFCKICDTYINYTECESHVSNHIVQRKRQITEDRKKAKAARVEAMRLARKAKMEEKLASNL